MKAIKNFFLSKIVRNTLVLFTFIFSTEVVLRLLMDNPFLNWATFRIGISSFIIALIIAYLAHFFSNLIGRICYISIVTIIGIYSWAQLGLYNYLGFYMGIGNSEQGAKVTSYIKDYLVSMEWQLYLIFIPMILIILYYIFIDRKICKEVLEDEIEDGIEGRTKIYVSLLKQSIVLVIIVISSLLYVVTIVNKGMQNELQPVPNKLLIQAPENSNLAVSQFGINVYFWSDIRSVIFKTDLSELQMEYTTSIGGTVTNTGNIITDYSRIIDDTAWKSLIDNEKNKTYNKLNNYFISREITPKNEYTGMFEGKNLIVVLMESVNMIAINEEDFPTLYKLYNEGISFTNNYSPRNNCSTGNNEFTSMTSLFTINNTCTANTYRRNTYFEAIFNMYKNAGYNTSSYHGYTEKYYYRGTIHPNMGSEKYYGVDKLGIKYSLTYGEWSSDVDFVKAATPNFINEDKFMAYLTSVTTHQTYNIHSEYGDMYTDLWDDTDYSMMVKRYLSKMKYLDMAMEELLNELEEAGKLEDTVIALFADHYPYGLTNKQINSVVDFDVNVNKEVDRTPMMIYNAGTDPIKIEKYTTMIDLLPTLLNLFNIEYDPRLYFGHDVFSDYDDKAIFADGSWQDEIGYYNAVSGKFIDNNNDDELKHTNEEIVAINNTIQSAQKMSALAIKNNYFNYLNKGLEKYSAPKITTTTQAVTEEE